MSTGALWGGLSAMVLRIASFLTGVLVARLVAPDEFGVFTVALTVHAVVVNISELGVGSYLVRHEGRPDRVAPTVAAIALISSTILALGMIGVAPAVADALGAPAATGPVRVLALTVLLAGYSVVPNALLIRGFRQDKRVLVEVAHFVAATSVLLGMAAAGSGIYALAWSRVAGQLVAVLLLVRLSPTGHRPHLDRSIVRSVLGFGAPLAAANLVGFTVLNLDFIVVGAVLGAVPLGLYTLAFNVSGWPSSVLNSVVNSVALPAIARVQHDRAQLSQRIASLVGALAAVALPVSALILALAEPVVVSVYGARWSGAAVALGALAAFGAIKVVNDLCANVLVGIGRPRRVVRSPGAVAGRAPACPADRGEPQRHSWRGVGSRGRRGCGGAARISRPPDPLDRCAAAPACRRRGAPGWRCRERGSGRAPCRGSGRLAVGRALLRGCRRVGDLHDLGAAVVPHPASRGEGALAG